jgi:hypothetical protein
MWPHMPLICSGTFPHQYTWQTLATCEYAPYCGSSVLVQILATCVRFKLTVSECDIGQRSQLCLFIEAQTCCCIAMTSLYLTSRQVPCVCHLACQGAKYTSHGNAITVSRHIFDRCALVQMFTKSTVKEAVRQLFIWLLVQFIITGTFVKHIRHGCQRQIFSIVEDSIHLGYNAASMSNWTPVFWGSVVSSPRISKTCPPFKCWTLNCPVIQCYCSNQQNSHPAPKTSKNLHFP